MTIEKEETLSFIYSVARDGLNDPRLALIAVKLIYDRLVLHHPHLREREG